MQLPRSFIILLSILIAVTFFVGSLRTFASAQAATVLDNLTYKTDRLSSVRGLIPTSVSSDFPSLGPTPTPPSASLLPPAATDAPLMQTPAPTLTPTVSPIPKTEYADTTGVIALGILMVVVVLIGIIWGERNLLQKKEPTKK